MTTDSAEALAATLRTTFLEQPFGIIRFWGFSLVRPNDQAWLLVSTHAEAERLDLVFVHESRAGLAGTLSIWEPRGLEAAPAHLGTGIALRGAARLRLDDTEATREGEQFRLHTPRGEGLWPLPDQPALVLAR